MRKKSENYPQFGQAPSKIFACRVDPAVGKQSLLNIKVVLPYLYGMQIASV
jgi:hypothetical protein